MALSNAQNTIGPFEDKLEDEIAPTLSVDRAWNGFEQEALEAHSPPKPASFPFQ